MDYTYLGRTGMKVSRVCLGCMRYGSSETAESAGDSRPANWSEARATSWSLEPGGGSRSRRAGAIGRRSRPT